MSIKNYLFSFVLLLFSCSKDAKTTYIYHYNKKSNNFSHWKLEKIDTIVYRKNRNKYLYHIPKNQVEISVHKHYLSFNNIKCNIIKSTRNGKVQKYFYNDDKLIDEEFIIYFKERYGIVAIESIHWEGISTFNNSNDDFLQKLYSNEEIWKRPEELTPPSPPKE